MNHDRWLSDSDSFPLPPDTAARLLAAAALRARTLRRTMRAIDPTHDYAHCGGPMSCRYCERILTETPDETCTRIAAENRARGFRAAARCECSECSSEYQFRTGITIEEEEMIPDPYEPDITRRRAADPDYARRIAEHADDADNLAAMAAFRHDVLATAATSRAAAAAPATSTVHREPPDGYALALERLKEPR
jgi:hypothetical protein